MLVGAHAVLANGGVIAPAGTHLVALAAHRHSVPFVVLVGLHKLSPLFPHDPEVTFNGRWEMEIMGPGLSLPCVTCYVGTEMGMELGCSHIEGWGPTVDVFGRCHL